MHQLAAIKVLRGEVGTGSQTCRCHRGHRRLREDCTTLCECRGPLHSVHVHSEVRESSPAPAHRQNVQVPNAILEVSARKGRHLERGAACRPAAAADAKLRAQLASPPKGHTEPCGRLLAIEQILVESRPGRLVQVVGWSAEPVVSNWAGYVTKRRSHA